MLDISTELEAIIRDFTSRLVTAAHVQVGERVLSVVAAALTEGGTAPARRLPGRKSSGAPVTAAAGPRKLKLSAKGLAARKVQGRYLGLLRGLQPGARARVQKVARDKGAAEAIKFAASLK
jgi:hypothetical protein